MAKACTVCHGSGQALIQFHTKRKPYWKDCAVCDGLGVVDIPWIRGHGGIDHIVTSSNAGWHTTACQSWGPGGERHAEPKRRCRKCLAEMKLGCPWKDGPRGCPTGTDRKHSFEVE